MVPVVGEILKLTQRVPGPRLVGEYLYGPIATGEYPGSVSDVDLLAIRNRLLRPRDSGRWKPGTGPWSSTVRSGKKMSRPCASPLPFWRPSGEGAATSP